MWKWSLLLLAGCAASPRPHAARPRAEEWVQRDDPAVVPVGAPDDASAEAPSQRLSGPPRTTHVIAAAAPDRIERPRVHRTIDLHLKQAKTSDALQFIADAGGFNIVLEGDLAAPVTVSLRRVDAFDALLAVAEAQGLGVSLERGIVMVGAHGSASAR